MVRLVRLEIEDGIAFNCLYCLKMFQSRISLFLNLLNVRKLANRVSEYFLPDSDFKILELYLLKENLAENSREKPGNLCLTLLFAKNQVCLQELSRFQ